MITSIAPGRERASPTISSTSSGPPARARAGRARITGYVYNDYGDAAVNVALRIHADRREWDEVATWSRRSARPSRPTVAPTSTSRSPTAGSTGGRGVVRFRRAPRLRTEPIGREGRGGTGLPRPRRRPNPCSIREVISGRSSSPAAKAIGCNPDRELYGAARPKQYCALAGPKTLLRTTLDRVARLIPPSRTVAVTQASHAATSPRSSPATPRSRCSASRATGAPRRRAAGRALDPDPAPDAVVTVFPTDHFIVEESVFVDHVAAAGAYVGDHREWLLLLGVHPSAPRPTTAGSSPASEWAGRPRRDPSRSRVPREAARGARAPAAGGAPCGTPSSSPPP